MSDTDKSYEIPDEEDFQLMLTRKERNYLIAVLEEKRECLRHVINCEKYSPDTIMCAKVVLDTILSIEDKICKA